MSSAEEGDDDASGFYNFVCVLFKSQLSCAITGEPELSFAENVCLYHDEKKQKREKSKKKSMFLGSLNLFLTCTVDNPEIISRHSLLVKALLPTESKYSLL